MALHSEIRNRFQLGPAYHMTHIENLPGIFSSGKLKSFNQVKGAYVNIANDDVQRARAAIVIPETNRALHDYVPLYFGFKTPMVACNQHQNKKIIFLRFSLDILGAFPDIVISDGNARSVGTRFRVYSRLDDIETLDRKAILTVKYAHDEELRRRKQAEILIPDELPLGKTLDIICYSDEARNAVITIQRQHGMTLPVLVKRGWYFETRRQGG